MKTQLRDSPCRILPVGAHIALQFCAPPAADPGGLFIPDSAGEQPREAKVVALGSGCRNKDGARRSFVVKVGDLVLVAQDSGREVRRAELKYTVAREEEIPGVLG